MKKDKTGIKVRAIGEGYFFFCWKIAQIVQDQAQETKGCPLNEF